MASIGRQPAGERLTSSQIAARFGYTPGAVSNWRRRHASFPSPGEDGRYALQEVAAWLQSREEPRRRESDPRQRLLKHAGRSWAAGLVAAAMVTVASRGGMPASWRRWADHPDDLERALDLPHKSLADSFRAAVDLPNTELDLLAALVEQLDPAGYPDTFDALVDDRHAARADADHVSTGDLADLLLALLPDDAGSVLDPACGQGRLLAAAAERVGPDVVVGAELDPGAWAVAAQRMVVHRLSGRIRCIDFFAEDPADGDRFDLVVAQPPLNQRIDEGSPMERFWQRLPMSRRRGSGDFAWLYAARSRLAEQGRAFVVSSAGATISSYDADARRELVRTGSVAAVMSLPGGLVAGTSVPVALWVLADREPGDLLFINAEPGDDVLLRGTAALRTWLYDPQHYADEPGLCKRATVLSALAGDAVLAPAKWTEAIADPLASRADASAALQHLESVRSSVHRAQVPAVLLRAGSTVELTNLQKLEDAGKLLVERPWHIPRSLLDEQGDIPYATRITDAGLQVTGHLSALPGKGAVVTQPGDVVLATIGVPRAVVDEQGGHVLGSSLWLLRPLGTDPRFAARVLTLLLANPRIATQAIGGSVRRLRSPADVSIPLLRHADAAALAAWTGQVDALRRDALALAQAAEDAIKSVSAAVDAGAAISGD